MKPNEEMMTVEVAVSFYDIVQSLSRMGYKDLVKLILKLDLQMCEVGFTEDLVRGLVKSLKADKDDVELNYIDWDKVK
jgi:hypothetical protein